MAIVVTKDRPDQRYYKNIVQGDDGNWSADQMNLDDTTLSIGGRSYPVAGLRTIQANGVAAQAKLLIKSYATEALQRNALFILATTTSGTPHDNAVAMMNWIASVNTYRDNEAARVRTLNFNQLIAYIVPVGIPPSGPWPAPPASLPPVTSPQAYAEMMEPGT
jgi:hypothetical protein